MRWYGFSGSIAFAAGAAALSPICWHLLGIPTRTVAFGAFVEPAGSLPGASALAWVWIGLVATYAYGLAPGRGRARRGRALGASLGLIAAGATAHWGGLTPLGVLAISAMGLSLARLVWSQHDAGIRRLACEAALCLGSIVLAGWLIQAFATGPLAFAAGVWGFFLVQSLALAGTTTARADDREGDAFEAAQRRLESLLAEAER